MRCLLADCDFPMSLTFTLAIAEDCRCEYCRRLLLDHKPSQPAANTAHLEQKVAELSDLVKGITHYLARKQPPLIRPKPLSPEPKKPMPRRTEEGIGF